MPAQQTNQPFFFFLFFVLSEVMNWDNTIHFDPTGSDSSSMDTSDTLSIPWDEFHFSSEDSFMDDVEECEISLPRDLARIHAICPEVQPGTADDPPTNTLAALPDRWQCRDFAVTISQTEVTASLALERITNHLASRRLGIKFIYAAQEEHANRLQHHLHIYISYVNQLRTSDHTYFNFIADKQANVQRVRNCFHWLTYCNKHNGEKASSPGFNVITYLAALKAKTSSTFTLVAEQIIGGQHDLRTLSTENPGFMLQNLLKVRKFVEFIQAGDIAEVQRPAFPLVLSPAILLTLSVPEKEILCWLRIASTGLFDRQSLHLRVVGGTGIGKTRLLRCVSSFFYCYFVPFNDKEWFDNFTGEHSFLIFDEFKSQMKIQDMNAFVDGSNVPLSRRHMGPYIHSQVIPCIMMTNYSWVDAYPKALSNSVLLSTVERRWRTIVISEGNTILTLCRLLEGFIGDLDNDNTIS